MCRIGVVYTENDNDTVLLVSTCPSPKRFFRRYMDRDGHCARNMIRSVWSSVSMFALAPLQDFLELDNSARMNYPGNPSGNWTWRVPEGLGGENLRTRVLELNKLYGRLKS
jgi:4-alpha-glucanotransferase